MGTTIFIIVVLAILGWAVFTQIQARQQLQVSSRYTPQEAERIVQAFFSVLWSSVGGPGTMNYTPKLRKAPPTMSIDITPNGAGSDVEIWTSAWATKFGVMNHATLMWRKRRSLAARLAPQEQPESPTTHHAT